jgi:hypothetical protein
MKSFILLLLISMFLCNSTHAQSLSVGSGYFFEHYRSTGEKSKYQSQRTSYYWAFLGGSLAFNFSSNYKWFKSLSVYSNFYPLMYGSDLTNYPENNFFVISQDVIAPEIGFLSYYQALNKPKHKIDLGTGISLRFVISPITGSQSGYYSSSLSYESAHIQKSPIAFLIPIDIKYTYNFKPQLGMFFSVKRTFGLFHWIEQRISYEYFDTQTTTAETGTATMVSNGGRSLIEMGLVFNLKRID